MENTETKEVCFYGFLNQKNQGDRLVMALFYAPDSDNSQWAVKKAKEIVPRYESLLFLIDKDKNSEYLSNIFVDLYPTVICYREGQEICRTAGRTTEKILEGVLEVHAKKIA